LSDVAEFLLSHFRLLLEILSNFNHALHLILQNLHVVGLLFAALLQLDYLVFIIAQQALVLGVDKTEQGGLLDI